MMFTDEALHLQLASVSSATATSFVDVPASVIARRHQRGRQGGQGASRAARPTISATYLNPTRFSSPGRSVRSHVPAAAMVSSTVVDDCWEARR